MVQENTNFITGTNIKLLVIFFRIGILINSKSFSISNSEYEKLTGFQIIIILPVELH
jgi:hypothetical protein